MHKIAKTDHIYFMGIAGTGMGSVAGLLREAGYRVSGSDQQIYPPMSDLLAGLDIPLYTPYAAENIRVAQPDLVVVANALSRGHEELEAVLQAQIPYTSFPALLGEVFLRTPDAVNIVVSGTHGKSTTSAWLAWILQQLGESPSYFIGGVPKGGDKGYHLGKGRVFILEGDEYDTAFFDKKSKFLHYNPTLVVINNIEYDHADIFPNLEAVQQAFCELAAPVVPPANIIVNGDDVHIRTLCAQERLPQGVTCFATDRRDLADVSTPVQLQRSVYQPGRKQWAHELRCGAENYTIYSPNGGAHNGANLAAIFSVLLRLRELEVIRCGDPQAWVQAAATFPGVKRRQEFLGQVANILFFRDFAHHPSAVRAMIRFFRDAYPDYRLFCAFDPKNATSRRSVFEPQYAEAFMHSDFTLLGPCQVDARIPAPQRMDTKRLAAGVGAHCLAFDSIVDMRRFLLANLRPGDCVVMFSCGAFSQLGEQVLQELKRRHPAKEQESSAEP